MCRTKLQTSNQDPFSNGIILHLPNEYENLLQALHLAYSSRLLALCKIEGSSQEQLGS